VYDFTKPAPGNKGFGWSAIDEQWLYWSPQAFRRALDHPMARAGFALDMNALRACDACVLVLPCGRSAHLELGYAVGAGKRTIVFAADAQGFEPELMYLMCNEFVTSTSDLLNALTDTAIRVSP
jgi:nucleoside 2-deoxyribosyltransferase